MRRRRRFSGDLKAKVALEALRGDRTLQEIASKHQVHPNQVSTWKRQAIEGLGEVFSNGVDRRRRDHESEVHELHAKIGELTVERIFCPEGPVDGCFIRELLLTFSLSSTTCDSAWVSRGFSVIKHV